MSSGVKGLARSHPPTTAVKNEAMTRINFPRYRTRYPLTVFIVIYFRNFVNRKFLIFAIGIIRRRKTLHSFGRETDIKGEQ